METVQIIYLIEADVQNCRILVSLLDLQRMSEVRNVVRRQLFAENNNYFKSQFTRSSAHLNICSPNSPWTLWLVDIV